MKNKRMGRIMQRKSTVIVAMYTQEFFETTVALSLFFNEVSIAQESEETKQHSINRWVL